MSFGFALNTFSFKFQNEFDFLNPSHYPRLTNDHLPGEICMDDKQYAKRALILAVTSFILSNSFLILPFIGIFFELFIKSEFPRYIFVPLVLLGLLSSLPIAIIAYSMGKRMKGSFSIINFTRILSLLAILASLFWMIMLIIAPIISRFGPGW